MKYCVSGRQPRSTLARADEIKMRYADIARVIDNLKDYPDKTIILEIPKDEEIDWDKIETLNKAEGNFVLALQDLNNAKKCNGNRIKWYWDYPIYTYYELQGIIALRPCYLWLSAPLCFDLTNVRKKTDIPIRLTANLAFNGYIPRENGLCGPWVRPEDVPTYEQWVQCLEFETEELGQERTLLHVYKDNKNWPGNLNLLFTNFNINVDNRAILEDLGERRANCGQICMSTGNCHYCQTTIQFATDVRKLHYDKLKVEKE